jgi:AcrR family transcriptional regulator
MERILVAAEELVVRGGIDALSTRTVAVESGVPVATLYQYFADRDAIIAALITRHVDAMDERVADAVAALEHYSVQTLVQATVEAYVAGYKAHPSYVVLWFQGRVSSEIDAFVRERTVRLAAGFREFAIAAGLIEPDTSPLIFELAGEMIDAFLNVAYRDSRHGDQRIVTEGIAMLSDYMERHATPAGRTGIPAAELHARLEV